MTVYLWVSPQRAARLTLAALYQERANSEARTDLVRADIRPGDGPSITIDGPAFGVTTLTFRDVGAQSRSPLTGNALYKQYTRVNITRDGSPADLPTALRRVLDRACAAAALEIEDWPIVDPPN